MTQTEADEGVREMTFDNWQRAYDEYCDKLAMSAWRKVYNKALDDARETGIKVRVTKQDGKWTSRIQSTQGPVARRGQHG